MQSYYTGFISLLATDREWTYKYDKNKRNSHALYSSKLVTGSGIIILFVLISDQSGIPDEHWEWIPHCHYPVRELSTSVDFDGTNYLVGIQGDAFLHYNITARLVSQTGLWKAPEYLLAERIVRNSTIIRKIETMQCPNSTLEHFVFMHSIWEYIVWRVGYRRIL